MIVDRYTKAVLTVIAACLVWLSVGGPSLLTSVSAQSSGERVLISGWVDGDGTVRPLYPRVSKGYGLPVEAPR